MAKMFSKALYKWTTITSHLCFRVVYIEQTKATWFLENGTCCHWMLLDLNLTWCILTILVKRKWQCMCIICWMTCNFIQCTTTRGEIVHPTFIATIIYCHISITSLAWASKNSYCPCHMTSSCQSTMEKRTSISFHMIECQSMWLHPLTKIALNSKEPMPCINKVAHFYHIQDISLKHASILHSMCYMRGRVLLVVWAYKFMRWHGNEIEPCRLISSPF